MKRIYFEMDNLQRMVDWLHTRPDGAYHILIGETQPQTAVDDILAQLDSPATTRAAELPQGVVFEDSGDE